MWESPFYLYMKMLFDMVGAGAAILLQMDSQLHIATDVR